MSLLLLARLPFSWLFDTARELRQAYGAWRTGALSYMRAHSKQQVWPRLPCCPADGIDCLMTRSAPLQLCSSQRRPLSWRLSAGAPGGAATAAAAAAAGCRGGGIWNPCSRAAAPQQQAPASPWQPIYPTGASASTVRF